MKEALRPLFSPDSRAKPAFVFLLGCPTLHSIGNTVKQSNHFRFAFKPSSTIASFAYGLVVVCAVLLASAGLSGCANHEEAPSAPAAALNGPRILKVGPDVEKRLDIRTDEVHEEGIAVPLHLTGRIEPDNHKEVDIHTRIAGRLTSILVKPGETVRQGQVMALVDSQEISDIQSELIEARSKLTIARLHQERERQIYEEQIKRPTSLITARANFDEAKVQEHLYETEFKRIKGLYDEKIAAAKDFVAAQAKLSTAKTHLKEAEVTLEREEHLYRNRAMLKRDYQLAQAEEERARNHVNTLTQRLFFLGCDKAMVDKVVATGQIQGNVKITAPITGVVTYRDISQGELVQPSTVLFTISDLSTMLLRVDLPEVDLPKVKMGDTVKIRISSYPGEVFYGTISYISVLVNEQTRTVSLRARLDNADHRLKKFMFAEIDLKGTPKTVLACPKDAIQENHGEKLVFVKTVDGFEERHVKTGIEGDHFVEILTGLKPGEKVATQGSLMLKNEITFKH